ncbi:AMP-binding protein [Amycolatopsis sp. VS8301801F10]|uniref:AMP-binding protein n=1 Tax=Amycolatopsis sp. VS8301801F10 TaxID=2652442 RepID=UPI0038FC860E
MTYRDTYERSIREPAAFWSEAARAVDWIRPPERILDETSAPRYRWFPDGVLNTCYNALDRHVEAGRGDQAALHWESPVTGGRTRFSYRELTEATAKFAGVLRHLGVRRGDRVLLYLPMIPEAVIAMLACARIGAVHSVVFGGFAAPELAARIDDARPAVLVTASCGIEPGRIVEYQPLVDTALGLAAHPPETTIAVQRPEKPADFGGRALDYADLMASADIPPAECVPVAATDPLYILYTSGTTGKPKGIVRDNGGHAVALSWSMANIYDIGPGDVMFTASDVGWVVGHSYIVYGPLLAGAATVLYEGKPVGTPDAGAFWRVVAELKVRTLFTAPTAIRAIRKEDPAGEHARRHDTSSLRQLFLAGERLDPATREWAAGTLGVPVTDHWWQTETGWAITAQARGIEPDPVVPGPVPMPGYAVEVLDDDGAPLEAGREGAVAIKLPLPPGTLLGLWGDDERYVKGYLSEYPGYYQTGDGGCLEEDGRLVVLGRTDDVMNVAGHRLSSGQIEAAVSEHPAVAECAVVGVRDELKGQLPRALVVVKEGADAAGLEQELTTLVRARVGPIATLSGADVVPGLPKTRSGKILRRVLRQLLDGEAVEAPSTLDDVSVLESLRAALPVRSGMDWK